MRELRKWLWAGAASVLMLGTTIVGPSPAAAQGATPIGAPVDIHEGTCEDPLNEPAYDAGQFGEAAFDEADPLLGAGLAEDEFEGSEVFGIDLDDDDALAEDEIVGAAGAEPVVYRAAADIDEEAESLEQYVILVHESPERYTTYLACGEIAAAEELDGGTVVDLEPLNNSGFRGFSVIEGGQVVSYAFEPAALPAPQPEQAGPAGPFPVGIHSGTCLNPVDEPAYDVGLMELIPLRATDAEALAADDEALGEEDEGLVGEEEEGLVGEEDEDLAGDEAGALEGEEGEEGEVLAQDDPVAEEISDEQIGLLQEVGEDRFLATDEEEFGVFGGLFEDETLDENDEGFLSDDLEGDGIAEIGVDVDGDGVLGSDEVIGEDVIGDGALERAEVDAFTPYLPTRSVYKVDNEIETNGERLVVEGPYVVVVHAGQDEGYNTYLACGEVRPIVEEDRIMVPLVPYAGSPYYGTAEILLEEGELAGYLFERQEVAAQPVPVEVLPTPTPTPVPPTPTPVPPTPTPTPVPPTPTPTPVPPTPTPTPVPTAVITETEVVQEEVVVTEVVTETEVVLAPTATAVAGPGAPEVIEEVIDLGAPAAFTAAAGEPLTLVNNAEVERTFLIEELGIEETVAPGDELEVTVDEPGTYDYRVIEDGEEVAADELIVE